METIITEEYQDALDYLSENDSGFLFLTGRAGTGKSTFLKVMQEKVNKTYVKVAPTGIAALNIGGETIHSFFALSTHVLFQDEEWNKDVKAKLQGVQILVIDEVSMVRADIMDRIDSAIRVNLTNDKPFGGLLVLAIGDLYQLPPVLTRNEQEEFFSEYDSPYFFSAHVFNPEKTRNASDLQVLELTKVFRQDNQTFINFLDSLREDSIVQERIDEVNRRIHVGEVKDDFDGIVLCTTNAPAEAINKRRIAALEGEEEVYRASVQGEFPPNMWPNLMNLHLKVGAKVIFIKNNAVARNGETGEVTRLGLDSVQVLKSNGHTVVVGHETWEYREYVGGGQSTVKGKFSQIPLKLGWAITIHKSQGMTIDEPTIIDTGSGCFADGQFYVAMSRITDPSLVKLAKPLRRKDVRASELVKYFMNL